MPPPEELLKVLTKNWRGTLLSGVVEEEVAKSSICRATAYHPLLAPLPLYVRVQAFYRDRRGVHTRIISFTQYHNV